jgi:hypothetical protein
LNVVEVCPHSFGKFTRESFGGKPVEVWHVGNLYDEWIGASKLRLAFLFHLA